MMTDRERLIELIQNSVNGCARHWAGIIADYLLANGVIVPVRCKDCVYFRESDRTNRAFCTYHGDDYEFETFPNHYCSSGVGVLKGA